MRWALRARARRLGNVRGDSHCLQATSRWPPLFGAGKVAAATNHSMAAGAGFTDNRPLPASYLSYSGEAMPAYQHVTVPAGGQKITVNKDYSINVPDQAIIPYIEGDGTGLDITPVMLKVVDAAVAKAYGGKRKIHWMEIYAGEKSTKVYGADVWLPDDTLAIPTDYLVSLQCPLTPP